MIVGSFATVWLNELIDIFQRSFPFSVPITTLTLGGIMIVFACVLAFSSSLTMVRELKIRSHINTEKLLIFLKTWTGYSSFVLLTAALGPLTLFFSDAFVDEAIIGFQVLFYERMWNIFQSRIFDGLQQSVRITPFDVFIVE